MLRLRAFRPSNAKIVKIQVHPTHPWLVTADNSDNVSVWNWEYRQVIYELKAGGVDQRRLVGAKLEKLAEGDLDYRGKPTEAIKGGSVKQVSFYDDDVHFWKLWSHRAAAAEAPSAVSDATSAFSSIAPATKGRHYLVICCENKAIFLDLVTMRGRDVPKQELDNKSLTCMEFLSRSSANEGALVAFGGSDGLIRVLSMVTWKLTRRYTGGHKGAINCLMTFMVISAQAMLVSGGSDGLLIIWSAEHGHDSRDFAPKYSLKAHDGGVAAVDILRISGSAPQLITVGADKTLAVWDTVSFREIRRIKPVPKMSCHSVASWCHPRAPNLDILTCVKDSHIWAIEYPTVFTRPLCELSCLVPPQVLASSKKLRVYCMVAHPLQPHLVATGTNVGIIISELDFRALPPVAALPSPAGSREHSAVFVVGRELKLLTFQLSNTANPLGSNESLAESARSKWDSETLQVNQIKKHISTSVPHDSYSVFSLSSSGKFLAVVWPDVPFFSIYNVSDWSIVDSGGARLLAWDTCHDRFAILESAVPPRIPMLPRGSLSRKAKEAAAAAAAAAAATAVNYGTVQVRILLDDGTSNILVRSIGARSEPVIGLHGGALLGIAYRPSRRANAPAVSMPSSGFGTCVSSFNAFDDGFSSNQPLAESSGQNFQLYSWETFEPLGSLLPQPEWTAWDKTVEYCAFAYQQYIVISSLRPQYRYLGDVAIPYATSAVWHRRQLFVATPTTIEVVFVDAGVALIDIETKRMKEEQKLKEARARAVAEHGELALICVDGPKADTNETMSLRPPMLQVVRLASFQHAPSVPSYLTLSKLSKIEEHDSGMPKERKDGEIAVAGGGVAVAVTRFPAEQKRPIGPLVVVGVRDGVLWLIDRYMQAHALSLSHPGIRCRCLAAYGDAVSAVKWATRLAREHHDDLAQFMLGMGYAAEALHLPGISKRLEFDLAMQGNDLKRGLQCLLIMSNSRDMGRETVGLDLINLLNVAAMKENMVDAVKGIAKFTGQFFDLIDAADATAQSEIAREALKRLAAAGSVKGALQVDDLRGLALRLANHGELTRLNTLVSNLISLGLGREAAFAAAVLGDNALMEKAWQETGMLAEAVLHSHAHGRPTLRNLVETWNKALQKEIEHTRPKTTDATAAFLASLEDPSLPRLEETNKKPPIEILPPGMNSLSLFISSAKKPTLAGKVSQQEPGKPLLLEAPRADSTQAGFPSTADSNQPAAAPSTDSGQHGAPSADLNRPAPQGVLASADSTERGAPGPSSDGSVASQSAECTQSGAPMPADSNQPEPLPSSDSNQPQAPPSSDADNHQALPPADEIQPLALPPPDVNQRQAASPLALPQPDVNQPLALPTSSLDQSQGLPSADGKQPLALPTGSFNQSQGQASPSGLNQPQGLPSPDGKQLLALPPASFAESQGLPASPSLSQGSPSTNPGQNLAPPMAAFNRTPGPPAGFNQPHLPSADITQPQARPSAAFDESQGVPSAGLNRPQALTSAGPGPLHAAGLNQSQGILLPSLDQSQGLPSAGLNQPPAFHVAGLNQSEGNPSPSLHQSQGLPSAGLNHPLALHAAGLDQSQALPSPSLHQCQGVPSASWNQPQAFHEAGLNQSQGIPSPSLRQSQGTPSADLHQPLALTLAGFDQSQGLPSAGSNQPRALHVVSLNQSQGIPSPSLHQSQGLPSAGLNQPQALHVAGLNQSQVFPPPSLNQSQGLTPPSLNQSQGLPPTSSNQPLGLPTGDFSQTQGLPSPVVNDQPLSNPASNANQPTEPPLVDGADFFGTKEGNPTTSTSTSTSTSSPLGGLELLL